MRSSFTRSVFTSLLEQRTHPCTQKYNTNMIIILMLKFSYFDNVIVIKRN